MLIRRAGARTARGGVAAAAALVLLVLGACESGGGGEARSTPPGSGKGAAVVIAPGRPGESAATISPEEAARRAPDDSPNAADVVYMRMMIVHHGQALEMTRLVPERAHDDAVKRIAERIAASQGPEIEAMKGWLKSHGIPMGSESAQYADMPGMVTEAQLARLRAAKGTAFDGLFLDLMIAHHQGAIGMAADVLAQGNNVQTEEMANDVVAQQTSEVARMRAL